MEQAKFRSIWAFLIKEDPDDNKILECAKAGLVDYIVTNDYHLLKIGVFEKIKIVKPDEFLSICNNNK